LRVRVTCRRCGDVSIGLSQLVLRFCEDDLSAAYRFRCPRCDLVQLEDASFEAATALLDAAATTEWWSLPADVGEQPTSGAPITPAEVAGLALVLGDDDAVAAELGMPGASPGSA
jgi:hypothetical protein